MDLPGESTQKYMNHKTCSFIIRIYVALLVMCCLMPSSQAWAQPSLKDQPRIELTEEEQAWLKEHPVIRVSNETDWPPYDFVKDSKPKGYSVDYVRLIAEKLGMKIEFVSGYSWDELVDLFCSKQIDLLHPTDKPKKVLDCGLLTDAFIREKLTFLTRNDYKEVDSMEDLIGAVVALQKGWETTEKVMEKYSGKITPFYVNSSIEGAKAVAKGQADAVIDYTSVLEYLQYDLGLTNVRISGWFDHVDYELFIGVRKDWPMLYQLVQKAREQITNKEIQTLQEKWLRLLDEPEAGLQLSESEHTWLNKHPTIRVGSDSAWAPIEFLDSDGSYKGLSIDYLKKIEPLLGIEFKFVQENWQNLIGLAKKQKLDLFSCVASTPEREQYLLFTEPYIQMPAGIFAQKDVAYIVDMKTIVWEKISVVEGYAIHDYLSAKYPDMDLVLVKTPEEGLRKVLQKKAFAYIDNIITTDHIIRHKGYLDIKMVGEIPFIFAQSMGTRKDWPQLRDILQKALSTIPDADRNVFYNKWVPITHEKPIDYGLLLKISAGCLILICLIFFWNRKLAAEVNKRTSEYKESENRFRSAFDYAGIGIGLVSLEGHWLKANQALCKIIGYTKEEMEKLTVQDITYPDDLEVDRSHVRTLIDGKANSYEMEKRYVHKDGRVIWIQLNASILRSENKLPLYFILQIQDINDRKQAEAALRNSEQSYRRLVENMNDGLAVIDENYLVTYANDKFCKMLGYLENEVNGRLITDFFDEENLNVLKRQLVLRREGKSESYEIDWVRKDGNMVPAWMSPSPIFDEKGNYKGSFSIVSDMTEKKRTEKKLINEQAFTEKIINSLPGVFYAFNEKQSLVKWNKNLQDLLGKSAEEIGLGEVHLLDPIPDDEKERVVKAIEHAQRTGENLSLEANFLTNDGSKIPMFYGASHIDISGEKYFLGIGIDISERKKLEDQLGQAQKMEAIGALAGGIAHDFNNILSPILGFTEMLQEDLPQNSAEQAYISQIFQAAIRAKDLIQQILAFSRRSDQELKPVKFQSILKEALKLLRSSIPKTIDIQTEIDYDCGVVVADPTQLHQIIMNLATNAYHAMQDSGGKLKVRLIQTEIDSKPVVFSELLPGKYALLKVIDTGIGIKKDVMDKIFDPYFTTKAKDKGTGLGLSVVQGIIRSCQGDIHIYSEDGKGTEVHVYLPIMKEATGKERSDPLPPIQGGTEKILLVDDEEPIVKMEKMILERLGYQVTSINESRKALELFKASPNVFDLVITDMTMPNLTGVQLASEIKGVRSDVPIIICTGFSDLIDEDNCKELGIQGYVTKPVIKREFARTIRDVLDKPDG